jgi:hypothetical protein
LAGKKEFLTMLMPSWLPHKVSVNGQWDRVLEMLYGIFVQDFIHSSPLFEGRMILWDDRILDGQYEEGFWHLITRDEYANGKATGNRLFDPPRAERLPWCAPTINNSIDPAVRVWNYREGSGRLRTYLWLDQFDYVIVLEIWSQRRGEVAFLFTAHHVDGASTRKKLQNKYMNREL